MSKVIVGRHVNGITLNDLEWLQNEDGSIRIFDSEDHAKGFLRSEMVTDEEMEWLVFRHSIGICKRCGSPLFPSQIEDYTSQCFTCDEDFFSFEQESAAEEKPEVPKCIGMTRPEFAKFLYEICQVGDSVTIYEEYNPEGNDPSFAYELQKIQFADSDMIIGNYWGGGSPFVDDITGDPDSTGLEAVLNLWFDEHEFYDTIWVERSAVTG